MASTEESRPESKLEPIVPETSAEADGLCNRYDYLLREKNIYEERVKDVKAEMVAILEGLAEFVEQHRRWWYPSKKSRVVFQRSQAVITRRLAPESLVVPADVNEEQLAIKIAAMEGCEHYVKIKYSLDKEALTNADAGMLKRFGLRKRKHWTYSLRTPNMKNAVQLLRIPYRAPRTKTN